MKTFLGTKTNKYLQSIVEDWKKIYERYDDAMIKYYSTSKLIRWWKGLKEPTYPGFRSTRVVEDAEKMMVIELRCNCRKLLAAVRVGEKGFLEDLSTGKRTPLLGARGVDIDSDLVDYVDSVIDDLKQLSL